MTMFLLDSAKAKNRISRKKIKHLQHTSEVEKEECSWTLNLKCLLQTAFENLKITLYVFLSLFLGFWDSERKKMQFKALNTRFSCTYDKFQGFHLFSFLFFTWAVFNNPHCQYRKYKVYAYIFSTCWCQLCSDCFLEKTSKYCTYSYFYVWWIILYNLPFIMMHNKSVFFPETS